MSKIKIDLKVEHILKQDASNIVDALHKMSDSIRGPFDVEVCEIPNTVFVDLKVTPTELRSDGKFDVDAALKAINALVKTHCFGWQLEGSWIKYKGRRPDCRCEFNGAESINTYDADWVFDLPVKSAKMLEDFAYHYGQDVEFVQRVMQQALIICHDRLMQRVDMVEEHKWHWPSKRNFVVFLKNPDDKMTRFELLVVSTGGGVGQLQMLREEPGLYEFLVE